MKYSIVIVTYNSANDIVGCLDSIMANTSNYEIIVVDNASKDDTKSILDEYDVKKIFNNDNNGFSKATNQGIRASSGDFIIMLNPDTRVYPDWADNMSKKFYYPIDGMKVGAVGPLSTNCIGYQHVNVLYPETRGMSEKDISTYIITKHKGEYYTSKVLIGFCMMTTRNIINEVGMLDERLFLGNDDLEYSWRLRYSGYLLVIAKDSFIAHDMQRSFKSKPKAETDLLVQQSTDILYQKLIKYFGCSLDVPAPMELWGIDWFKPTDRERIISAGVDYKRFFDDEYLRNLRLDNVLLKNMLSNDVSNLKKLIEFNSVCDIGAGIGMIDLILLEQGHFVTYYDANPYHCKHFSEFTSQYKKSINEGDFLINLEGYHDLIICIEVFEHIPDDRLMPFIKKLHKHGKYFLFTSTPYNDSNIDDIWGHINVKTTEAWQRIFEDNGWKLIAKPSGPTEWALLFQSKDS